MAGFFVSKKSTPSSASKAASGVMERKSGKKGKHGKMKSGKGHFAAAAQRIAKLRSGTLQHGVPKNAPMGAMNIGGSGMTATPSFGKPKMSIAQQSMNEEQE